jgi:hypothetical protein
MTIYFFIILVASVIALVIAEIILTKNQLGRKLYLEKINPEPFVFTSSKQGFRVRSADVIYSKNRGDYFRIICLGDSFTFGHGVTDDKTYPVFLEKYLENTCQRKIQVINAGVCGATITEELYMYIKNCAQLQSNLVVLLFQPADIEYEFTRILLFKAEHWKPWFLDKYLQGSKVYSLIKLNIVRQQDNYAASYYNKHKEYVISKYLESLESLNSIVKANNSVLVVVFFMKAEIKVDRALKRFCDNQGIQSVDITEEYAQRAAKGGVLLIVHHNEIGNNYLAKLIAQKLSEKILVSNNF